MLGSQPGFIRQLLSPARLRPRKIELRGAFNKTSPGPPAHRTDLLWTCESHGATDDLLREWREVVAHGPSRREQPHVAWVRTVPELSRVAMQVVVVVAAP